MSWGGEGGENTSCIAEKYRLVEVSKFVGKIARWLERPRQVPSLSRRDAGSILAGNNSFVLGALYQQIGMTLVWSTNKGVYRLRAAMRWMKTC